LRLRVEAAVRAADVSTEDRGAFYVVPGQLPGTGAHEEGGEVAGADEVRSREANCRTVLAKLGLAVRKSGGGYQVVRASTLEAVAGRQGPDGYSMSLDDVEGYAVMAVWAKGRADGPAQLAQAAKLAGWAPDAPQADSGK